MKPFQRRSILPEGLRLGLQGIADEVAAVQLLMAEGDHMQGGIVIGRVIIRSAVGVPAGGIDGLFIDAGLKLAAAGGLRDRGKDVEQLRDALRVASAADAVHPCKGSAHKP